MDKRFKPPPFCLCPNNVRFFEKIFVAAAVAAVAVAASAATAAAAAAQLVEGQKGPQLFS